MRFYLASNFSSREDMKRHAQELRLLGHIVECRWFTDPDHGSTNEIEFNRTLANHDWEDLFNSECMVVFIDGTNSHGGKYVELGLALAWSKPIIIVGERSNVFTYLENIILVETWEQCMELFK